MVNATELALPERGALLDQAAWFVHAIAVVQRLQEEVRKRRASE